MISRPCNGSRRPVTTSWPERLSATRRRWLCAFLGRDLTTAMLLQELKSDQQAWECFKAARDHIVAREAFGREALRFALGGGTCRLESVVCKTFPSVCLQNVSELKV